jgi:hypothetical protein
MIRRFFCVLFLVGRFPVLHNDTQVFPFKSFGRRRETDISSPSIEETPYLGGCAEEAKTGDTANSSCSPDHDRTDGYETEQSVNKPGGFGGYILPSTSNEGPQVHRCPLGTLSITAGICFPHPHQETFSSRKDTNVKNASRTPQPELNLLHLGQSARMHMMEIMTVNGRN